MKKNYLYSLMKVINQVLFPVLTIPYVSRVLGAEGIGVVEYFMAIASYGLLISGFGLPHFASIEVAKLNGQTKALKEKTISMFNFQSLTTLVGGFVFIIICLLLGVTDKVMMAIFLLRILLNLLRVEWYFVGTENFKYIAIRDLAVKISFLIIIYVFVTDSTDTYYYAIALVLGDGIANLFNIRKMLTELKLSILELLRINLADLIHIYKATLPFFFAGFAITLYITVDKVMLGQMVGDSSVGYYSMPERLVRIAMGVALALATAITPRLAYYYQHDKKEYFKLLNKATKLILMLTIPLFVGMVIMAQDIVLLVFGNDFIASVPTLQILSLFLIVVPFASILGLQVLNVVGEPKKYTISVLFAAFLNIILNIFLIERYQHNGAAIASIIAESTAVLIQGYYVSRLFPLGEIFDYKIAKYFISSFIMGLGIYYINILGLGLIEKIISQIFSAISIYLMLLIILKDEFAISTIEKIKGYI